MLATQPKPQCDAFKKRHLDAMCNDASLKCKVLFSEISDMKLEEVQRSCYLRVLEKNPSDTLEHDIEVVKTKRRLSEVRAELEALNDKVSEIWDNLSDVIYKWSTAKPLDDASATEEDDEQPSPSQHVQVMPKWFPKMDTAIANSTIRTITWGWSIKGKQGKTYYIDQSCEHRNAIRINVLFDSNHSKELDEILKQICDAVIEGWLNPDEQAYIFFDIPRGKKIPKRFMEMLELLLYRQIRCRKYKGFTVKFNSPPKVCVFANEPPPRDALHLISADRLDNSTFFIDNDDLHPDLNTKLALERVSALHNKQQAEKAKECQAVCSIATLFEELYTVHVSCDKKLVSLKDIRTNMERFQKFDHTPQRFRKELYKHISEKYRISETSFSVIHSSGHNLLKCVVPAS